jgi:ribokinase
MNRYHNLQSHAYPSREELNLICFGNPELDRIHADNSDRKVHRCSGGSAANIAVAFAGLGGKVGLAGCVGNDAQGAFLLSRLKRTNVDIGRIQTNGHPTTVNEIHVAPTGRRIVHSTRNINAFAGNGDAGECIRSAKAVLAWLRDEKFEYYAELAKRNNVSLYVNAHGFNKERCRIEKHNLRRYDITAVIGNKHEMTEVEKHCTLEENTTLVMTMGEKGSRCFSHQMETCAPSFPVKSVDLTGAGDAFAAGYIYASLILKSFDYSKLIHGNACAALAMTGYGAQQNITMARIDDLLRKYGYISY